MDGVVDCSGHGRVAGKHVGEAGKAVVVELACERQPADAEDESPAGVVEARIDVAGKARTGTRGRRRPRRRYSAERAETGGVSRQGRARVLQCRCLRAQILRVAAVFRRQRPVAACVGFQLRGQCVVSGGIGQEPGDAVLERGEFALRLARQGSRHRQRGCRRAAAVRTGSRVPVFGGGHCGRGPAGTAPSRPSDPRDRAQRPATITILSIGMVDPL